jgi:hypothetical protein
MWAVAYAASPAGVAVAVTAGIATFVALALALGLPTDEERDVIRRRLGRTRRPSTV